MADALVGKIQFQTTDHRTVLTIDPDAASAQIVYTTPAAGPQGLSFRIMEIANTGSLTLKGAARLDGSLAALVLGGGNASGNKAGVIRLINNEDKPVIALIAASGNIRCGGNGQHGDVALFPAAADNEGDFNNATVHFKAENGHARLGGAGASGRLELRDKKGDATLAFEAGVARLGGAGSAGRIDLWDAEGRSTAAVENGHLRVGGNAAADGRVTLKNKAGTTTLLLDGGTGDIVLKNADCAEDFDVAEPGEPGELMVIGEDGRLRRSRLPYDRAVAGVLSGAGDLRPGLILDRSGRAPAPRRAALAMFGKVYCKVDASFAPIRVGDLLTTSSTPGHAMRAGDASRAFGAVVGKALRPHREGAGLIPILVAMQ